MNDKSVAFHDLPKHFFPFRIEIVGHDDEVLWEVTVHGPCALEVPGMPGQVKTVRITYANGRVVES